MKTREAAAQRGSSPPWAPAAAAAAAVAIGAVGRAGWFRTVRELRRSTWLVELRELRYHARQRVQLFFCVRSMLEPTAMSSNAVGHNPASKALNLTPTRRHAKDNVPRQPLTKQASPMWTPAPALDIASAGPNRLCRTCWGNLTSKSPPPCSRLNSSDMQ